MKFKRFKYAALAAAVVASAAVVPAAADAASGWEKDGKRWKYSNGSEYAASEWVGGYWIRKNGYWDGVTTKAKWGQDDTGWYFGYKGWYATNQWQKIDGVWYFFDKKGYMVTDAFIKGYYVGEDGAYVDQPRYTWHKTADGKRWWFGKNAKLYVSDGWYKINGDYYYFDEEGYCMTWTLKKIDGAVVGFDSNGHAKPVTMVTPAETVTGEITFKVTEKNKAQAAADMDAFLVMYTKAGAKKVMTIGDEDKTVEHVSEGAEDYITVDGEKLTDYVARVSAGSITVKGSGSSAKLLDEMKFIADQAESKSYNYSVTIGGVKFTKFRMNYNADGAMYFTADKTNFTCIVDAEYKVAYILSDVTGTSTYAALAEAGVIDDDFTYISDSSDFFPEWQ